MTENLRELLAEVLTVPEILLDDERHAAPRAGHVMRRGQFVCDGLAYSRERCSCGSLGPTYREHERDLK